MGRKLDLDPKSPIQRLQMEFMEQWQYINILGHYISIFKPRKGLTKSQRGMKSDCLKKDLKESEIIILSEKEHTK